MSRSILLITTALLLSAHGAFSQTCSFMAQSNSTRPSLPGRVVYEMEDDTDPNNPVTALYLYDFANHSFTTIPMSSWGLTLPFNPVFSPDGKAIVFSAANGSNLRDLYYWPIGSANAPYDLTAVMDTQQDNYQRNEDVKFSADGHKMVWKQHFGIATADFALDNTGAPVLSNHQRIIGGTKASSSEASGPVFSPTNKYIYYFTGVDTDLRVRSFQVSNGAHGALPRKTGYSAYYPADPDLLDVIYVAHPDAIPKFDKINMYSSLTGNTYVWNAADCNANDSDPATVDEDYFLYSRTNNADFMDYDLYIGQWSTGFSWSLSDLGLNGSRGGVRAANYTTAR